MDNISRYSFTNFTSEPFTGRYSGVNYSFAPGETREFDPDKHYMLKLMAKQLADQILLKGIKTIGRNPNDLEKFGKSLDENGNIYTITVDMRKEIMRKAIGDLADKPIPVPQDQIEEAGSTQKSGEDVKTLQDQVAHLTDLVTTLTSKIGAIKSADTQLPAQENPRQSLPSMGLTREILESMAQDRGIKDYQNMTKEQLVSAVAA